MKEMTFEHDHGRSKETLRIIYIEYHGRLVHSVTCDTKEGETFSGYCSYFDFEMDCKGIEKFMFYDSGGGGKITQLQAPHYVKSGGSSYWMHQDAKFKGKPKNIVKRKNPIRYIGDPNPFNHGREIFGQDYCKFCKKWYDQDACPDHHVISDDGELQYFDGSKADS